MPNSKQQMLLSKLLVLKHLEGLLQPSLLGHIPEFLSHQVGGEAQGLHI